MEARKKKTSVGGRPKEYSDKMRLISLSVPESLLKNLDSCAKEGEISRQRLIIEWLKMATFLKDSGFLRVMYFGTLFKQFPDPLATEGCKSTTTTIKEMAAHCAKEAKIDPDRPLIGQMLVVDRDSNVTFSDVVKAFLEGQEEKKGQKRP